MKFTYVLREVQKNDHKQSSLAKKVRKFIYVSREVRKKLVCEEILLQKKYEVHLRIVRSSEKIWSAEEFTREKK